MKFETEIDKDKIEGYLKVLKVANAEAKVIVDRKMGIQSVVVDPAHVLMIATTMEPHAFDKWDVDDGNINIDLEKAVDCMRYMKKDIKIKLTEGGALSISSHGLSRRMALLEDIGPKKIPQVTMEYAVRLDVKFMKDMMKAANDVGSTIHFNLDKTGMTMLSEGDTDSVNMVLTKADLKLLQLNNKEEPMTAMYPLDYLQRLTNVVKSETLEIQFQKTDGPLQYNWQLPGESGTALAMLAPRIDKD